MRATLVEVFVPIRDADSLWSAAVTMTHSPTISAPVAMITPDNHGGLVLITNAFGLILVLIFLVIRILARVIISPPFDKDDLALVVATVGQETLSLRRSLTSFQAFCIIHSSLVFAAVSHGFGKTTDLIEEADLLSSQKVGIALSTTM